MIKKIIATIIFSVFCFCGAFCDTQNRLNYFDTSAESGKTYTYGIKPEDYGLALRNLSNRVKYFDLEGMAELIKKYRKYNYKFGISIYDLLNVCIAGGITYCGQNPTDPQCKDSDGYVGERVIGYDECMRFIDDLITVANERAKRYKGLKDLKVYPIDNASDCSVAGGEWQKNPVSDKFECIGKDGYEIILSNVCVQGREVCVDIFKEVEFQQYTGLKLAELWGRKNGLTLTCANRISNTSTSEFTKFLIRMGADAGQDFILCSAGGKPYAFEFNDLLETGDFNIESGVIEGICKLFNLKGVNQVYGVHFGTPNMVLSGGGNIPYSGYTGPHGQERKACENTNLSTCQEINRVATVAGYVARFENGDCLLEKEVKTEESLRTAYNINNRVFQSSVQVNLDSNIENVIRDYVSEHLKSQGIKLDSFYCNISSTKIGLDDFLTCYVNGKPVDFVFNDLSESWDSYDQSGREEMNCVTWGGTFSGKYCIGLDKNMCDRVRLANKKTCPECQYIRWNDKTSMCELPASAGVDSLKKGLTYSAMVAGVAVSVVITVGTMGAGAPVAVVLTGLETIGGVVELTAQVNIDNVVDDFLVESNKCKDATCAKEMLAENLQRMANYANDMTAAEADAVDTEMARLANLIPDDDEIWATMLVNGTSMEDNQSGVFDTDSWEPEQVWRAVGIGLQLGSLITGITKWAISKSSRVVKSTVAIKQKLARAVQSIDNVPESTLHGDRLALKQQRVKNAKLWKPGEDVANYYDVEALQKQFNDIAAEDADYIKELKDKYTELRKSVGTDANRSKARTLETNKQISLLRIEKGEFLKEYEEALENLQVRKVQLSFGKTPKELESMPEYVQIMREYESLMEQKRLVEESNSRIVEINKEIAELEQTYKPEAVGLINEQNYISELIVDAEKTIGDKQNKAWWDAIPDVIKERYVEYNDKLIVELLAQDEELSWYVNNFTQIAENPDELRVFYKALDEKINTIFPENSKISTDVFYDEFSGQEAAINKKGDVLVNGAKVDGLDKVVANVKHEVLGHHVDDVMPNHGLQGETMQNFVSGLNNSTSKRIDSHYSHRILEGRAPLTGQSFDLTNISEEVIEKLRNEGWVIRETEPVDVYNNGYRQVLTEQEAWLLTPTRDIRKKVNAYRASH